MKKATIKVTDFIKETYKKVKNVNDNYATTEAHFRAKKIKPRVEAEIGDVVLLVTKKGHEYKSGHVGTVTAVGEETYSFDMMFNGSVKSFTLPYNFLAKEGMITVGFYTAK